MSSKFNLKELKKSRSLLPSQDAKDVLLSSPEDTPPESNSLIANTEAKVENTLPKRGRPAKGKRSDPDYVTALAYVRKDTYDEVRNRLFLQRREYSDLVQELLAAWLKSKQ